MLSISIIAAIASCGDQQKSKQLEEEVAALKIQLQQRDSSYNEALTIMDQVESKLENIKDREKLISTSYSQDMRPESMDRILTDLSMVDDLLVETDKTISRLASQLERSGIDLKSFKRRIKQLNEKLKERDQSIKMLKKTIIIKDHEIDQLRDELAVLTSEVSQQSELIDNQVRLIDTKIKEINSVYYVVGDEKILLQKEIIRKKSGFLSIGRTYDIDTDITTNAFKLIDKTKTLSIPINNKKAEILTDHPEGSYKFQTVEDQIKNLIIEKPEEFWKFSKFLVVSI